MVYWILSLVHSTSITSSTCLIECIISPTLFSGVLCLRVLYHFSTSCLSLKSSKSSWSFFYPLTPTSCQWPSCYQFYFLKLFGFFNLGEIHLHFSTSSLPLSLSLFLIWITTTASKLVSWPPLLPSSNPISTLLLE